MTRNQIVPRSHWNRYLKAISGQYYEQPVAVEQELASGQPRAIVRDLYFMGASLEGGYDSALVLHLSRLGLPQSHISHRIANPMLVLREEDDRRDLARIVIEDNHRERTVLLFEANEPAPDRRPRLLASLQNTECDHPRCPLTPLPAL